MPFLKTHYLFFFGGNTVGETPQDSLFYFKTNAELGKECSRYIAVDVATQNHPFRS